MLRKIAKARVWVAAAAALTILFAFPAQAAAMHIMEGMLPTKWCIFWAALYIPFFARGIYVISKKCAGDGHMKLLLAMSAAYCFILSALKLPSVTGSSSHPTGTGLGAVLFGPSAMSVLGLIVLAFQALLLAHGGLSTLGANAISMAVVGPFAGYGVYLLLGRMNVKKSICVFAAAFTADLVTYVVTSFQLGLAFQTAEMGLAATTVKFLGVFAVTQIPLAIAEGLLTVVIFNTLKLLSPAERSLA
ncbi:MAG: energy-coupling factor ABC transporter permease [Clostridiales Family XIII bacterium]|jgi:cobalt/nickel transport system permease protein|nr:energy-coupling factor ABC transporter permease [Clostridiales Family XIII bacterium]